jgi:putative pyruvate formate lyase activating enzyme
MIVRHLVLPQDASGTGDTLMWVRDSLPRTITLSLMAQFSPLHKSHGFPPLDRKLSVYEYDHAVDMAWELGFENVFVQDPESRGEGIPDFQLDKPFKW